MNNYRAGVRGEKKTRAWLEGQGYFVVEARGSHGIADLIAISLTKVLVVQVKTGRKISRRAAGRVHFALRQIPMPYAIGERWLVSWPKYARAPVVEVVQ